MEEQQVPGFEIPLNRALTEKMLWCGVPRELFLLNILSAVFIVAILHFFSWIPVAIIGHFVFFILAKDDPFVFDIFIRYQSTKKYYWS